jgi:hypothetical protein
MPYAIVWSGWGLLTLALGAVAFLSIGVFGVAGRSPGFFLAALLNFGLVMLLGRLEIERNGRYITRAQESTLFFMPLHYWTYIFLAIGAVLLVRDSGLV